MRFVLHNLFSFSLICFVGVFLALLVFPQDTFALVPTDPFAKQDSYTLVKAYEAWDITTGSKDVVVAIMDNGWDTFHPDLRDNRWINPGEIPKNGIDDDNNGYIDDIHGWNFADHNNDPRPDVTDFVATGSNDAVHHGTVVAGIIGARANNNVGAVGINWDVQLMNLKVLGNDGTGTASTFADALRYAVDNGADVVNISLVSQDDLGISEAIRYAYENGVVVVAASGNNQVLLNSSPRFPVCADAGSTSATVLGVSAVFSDRRFADFSNVGSSCIDLTAPGVGIGGPIRFSPKNGFTDRFSFGWSGTSFAAPFVSGAAALIKSVQPTWGPDEIFDALVKNTSRTPTADEDMYQTLFGNGLLQINKAVAYAASQQTTPPRILTPVTPQRPVGSVSSPMFGVFHPLSLSFYRDGNTTPLASLGNMYDLAVYEQDGHLRYVTLTLVDTVSSEIAVYDATFRLLHSWQVPLAGPLTVLAADVTGQEDIEIVVGSTGGTKELFRVYSLDGTLLKTYNRFFVHTGVSLGTFRHVDGTTELLLAHTYNDEIRLEHFTREFRLKTLIRDDAFSSVGSVSSMIHNGETLYVLGSGGSQTSTVLLFDEQTALFNVFEISDDTDAVTLATVDYDGDGEEDILAAGARNGGNIGVWHVDGQRQTTFAPFTAGQAVRLLSF